MLTSLAYARNGPLPVRNGRLQASRMRRIQHVQVVSLAASQQPNRSRISDGSPPGLPADWRSGRRLADPQLQLPIAADHDRISLTVFRVNRFCPLGGLPIRQLQHYDRLPAAGM